VPRSHDGTLHHHSCVVWPDAGGWERVWEHVQTKEKAGSERIAKLVGDVQDLRRQMSQVTQSKDERITAQVCPLPPSSPLLRPCLLSISVTWAAKG